MNLSAVNNEYRVGVNPKKFLVWCVIASITMMFAALTSAYIVRKSAGNWLEFEMPYLFFVSTAVILISSLTLHASYKSFLNNKPEQYRLLLLITFVLGIVFLITQYLGWQQLVSVDIHLNTNPSASFLYIISGLHAAHIIGGVAALTVALTHAYRLEYKVTEKRKNRFEMVTSYWHFVDVLWIYLLIFFIVQ